MFFSLSTHTALSVSPGEAHRAPGTKNIINALKGRSACLIENHGQVSFSNSLSEAFELAQEVEYLSEQYLGCLRTGKPKILSKSQMQKVLLKVKNYKQD